MANDLILVCADAARNPAWGLFLVSRVGPEGVILENVAGLTPDTINGLPFLRSPLGPLPVGKLLREARDRKSVVLGRSVSVRVDLGGGRFINKKKTGQLLTSILIK